MKLYKIKTALTLLFASVAIGGSAQALRSAYFLEGYVYRHQLNPAFMGERNYFSIPMLGNMDVAVQGNVGLSDFLYKYNDPEYSLTTFMNSSVGRNEFLDKMHTKNRLNTNIDLTILSFGFHKWGGFNTFDLNLHSRTAASIPYSLFDFMKSGMDAVEGNTYHIEDLSARTNNYVEASFGHARRLLDGKLGVGAKFKLLFGAGNANARIERMDIKMTQDQWHITAEGTVDGSLKGGYFETKEELDENDRPTGRRELDGFDVKSPGLGGFGMAIDLGATYNMDEFVEGLKLSASLLDFGFISWNNHLKASNDGSREFLFDGFQDIAFNDENGGKDLSDQVDDLGDDLGDLFKFYDSGMKGRRATMLAATLNIGAEYALPYYKKLRFGFLSTTHFNKPFTWSEGRFSANIAPVGWFDASLNYACSTFGSSLGLVVNFHPKGFNFFIGTDHMITRVNPQFIPIRNANANVSFGFNITLGDKK